MPQEKDRNLASLFYLNTKPIIDDDITSGKRWETLLKTAITDDPTLNNLSAAIKLLLQMQKDAFPNGLQSIQNDK